MSNALHAEWTKLRTLASSGWLLGASIVLTVGLSAGVTAAVTYASGSQQDITQLSLTGIELGQAVVAVLAVVAVSNEYATGMIRITLTAIPSRFTVLAAKAVVVAVLTLGSGAIAIAGCLLAGRLIPPNNGFTPAHGYALLSVTHGPTLRAAAGSVLYLALISLLGVGIATAVRDAATAIGTVLGLLYVPPIVARVVADPNWHRHLEQIAPTSGLAIEATTRLGAVPIAPWSGLGVLAAWAMAALLVGGLLLKLRDA